MNDVAGIVVSVEAERPLTELATAINASHQEVESALKAGLAHALETGRLLSEAKRRIGRGKWLPWLKANVAFSERTAQNYMRLDWERDWLTANPQRVSDLSYRGALAVLAGSDDITIPMPALREGCSYFAFTNHKPPIHGQPVIRSMEIVPCQNPGFWRYALHEFTAGASRADGTDIWVFCVRGERLDEREWWMEFLDRFPDVRGVTEWQEYGPGYEPICSHITEAASREHLRLKDLSYAGRGWFPPDPTPT